MKQDKLMDAIGQLPDDLLEEAEAARVSSAPKQKHTGRLGIRMLIAAVLAGSLAFGALGAYQRWHMPYHTDGFQGSGIQTQTVNTYPVPTEPDLPSEEETVPSEPDSQPFSDAWFLSQAREVLRILDREVPDATTLEVVRQKNLWWNREEVEVFWKAEDQAGPSVKFDAETGYLIGVTAFGDPDAVGPMMSESEALKTAEDFYDALPYAKGYTFRHVEKICDTDWMYYFDRPVSVEIGTETLILQSDYEQVRITINPCTGNFELSNCFYVPLLDDHEPGEVPLTMDQAITIAAQSRYLSAPIDSYEVDAEIEITLPNLQTVPFSPEAESATETGPGTEKYPYCDVTRLAWVITFRERPDPESIFEDEITICVDLYTGEILAVAATC